MVEYLNVVGKNQLQPIVYNTLGIYDTNKKNNILWYIWLSYTLINTTSTTNTNKILKKWQDISFPDIYPTVSNYISSNMRLQRLLIWCNYSYIQPPILSLAHCKYLIFVVLVAKMNLHYSKIGYFWYCISGSS